MASLDLPRGLALVPYLETEGHPIRYPHVRHAWPLSAYQTVYGTEPGSAEMPSAGRAFTPEVLTALMTRGVAVAPLVLHTGVSSPEAVVPALLTLIDHDPPSGRYRAADLLSTADMEAPVPA